MYSIKDLLILNQYQAYCKVKQLINKFPKDSVRVKDGSYLVMNHNPNDLKPMLCVHLDTVDTHTPNPKGKDFALPNEAIDFDHESKIYSIKPGYNYVLGADDRAGLWVVLRILADKDLYDKYSYGFFFDEEIGGIGSSDYRKDYKDYEAGVSAFIGLDRRGVDQVATYGSDNAELLQHFLDMGYKEASGSFTDASNLSHTVACVNISVGYDNEHSSMETLNVHGMNGALATLQTLYKNISGKVYAVEDNYYDIYNYHHKEFMTAPDPMLCDCCGIHAPLYDDYGYQVCEECIGIITKDLL